MAQPIQTAQGQEYGKAQQQEQAQRQVPLPTMDTIKPGGMGDFSRPTEMPEESVTTPMDPMSQMSIEEDQYSLKMARMMPYLLEAASRPTASPSTRSIVNQLALQIPPISITEG
jgi:hypothetical protein|tara:strand:- start:1556 stop:1897 length:342 start_codon:yes stop_codon:yes gene_type:complete